MNLETEEVVFVLVSACRLGESGLGAVAEYLKLPAIAFSEFNSFFFLVE